MKEIEPKILPLVDALNTTGMLQTFSSCAGHFSDARHGRHIADVRFYANEDTPNEKIEHFLTRIVTDFNDLHSFSPVTIFASKNFTPFARLEREFTVEPTSQGWGRQNTGGRHLVDQSERKRSKEQLDILDEYSGMVKSLKKALSVREATKVKESSNNTDEGNKGN